MAFTTDEEAAIRQALFGSGGQISELPVADNLEGALIEVQVPAGESRRVNLMSAVSALNKSYAGRVWDESLSTPTGLPYGNVDLLRELPALLGLGCYLVADDRKRRKLDPTDHHRFVDGSPAALDGAQGQYMWCWNAHYFGFRRDSAGKYYEVVSLAPLGAEWESYYIPAGGTSALGGGVIDRQATGGAGSPRLCSLISDLPRYRGGGNQAAFDDLPNSMLGKPATNTSPTDFFTFARDRGDLWGASWYVSRAVQAYLFRLIMGTRNSQAEFNPNRDANGLYQGGLGAGITTFGGTTWANFNGNYPIVPCSAGVELGDGVGVAPFELRDADSLLYTGNIPVFFGLKNMFGHLETFISGIRVSYDANTFATKTYVATSMYSFNPEDNTLNAMVKVLDNTPESYYAKKISMSKLCGVPTESQASSLLYYCDRYLFPKEKNYASGNHIVTAGGNATGGGQAGVHYFSVAGNGANWMRTAPLCFFMEDPIVG